MKMLFAKNIGLEGYEAEPFFPARFIVEDNQKAIANALVPLWLSRFTSPRAIASVRLETYEVNGIKVGEWKENRFTAWAKFSVKPLKTSHDEWLFAKGRDSGDWIQNLALRFIIVKQGEGYIIESVDTVA